jgi:histidinol dehydrogenase
VADDDRIIVWETCSLAERERVLGRNGTLHALVSPADLSSSIESLVADVRSRGDQAVVDALAEFDRVTIAVDRLKVSDDEIARAIDSMDPSLHAAIKLAIERSTRFNEEIVRRASWTASTEHGGRIGEIARPVESVGLFVPSGKGSFPSVMIQIGVGAVVAGVTEVCVVVPPLPGSDGSVDPATLVAANELGFDNVFRVNGPAGIAALTYGTEQIPRVRKIVGPGSTPVTIAQALAQRAGCAVAGGLGPTDSMIIADSLADPVLLAADLINEAEHGPDSSAVLTSTDRDLLRAVMVQVDQQIALLPEPRRQYAERSIWSNGGIIWTPDDVTALEIANDYAPEHLMLAVKNPQDWLPGVRHAGTVLQGQWSTFAASNFVIGTPATLPTTGFAKAMSGVTAHTYLNTIAVAEIGEAEFRQLGDAVKAFAHHEGFPAHAQTVDVRENRGRPEPWAREG